MMNSFRLNRFLFVITDVELVFLPGEAGHAADVRSLRCEYLHNPLGVDATRPRLDD